MRSTGPAPTGINRTDTTGKRPEHVGPKGPRTALSHNIRTVQWEDTPRGDGDNPLRKVRENAQYAPRSRGWSPAKIAVVICCTGTPRKDGDSSKCSGGRLRRKRYAPHKRGWFGHWLGLGTHQQVRPGWTGMVPEFEEA